MPITIPPPPPGYIDAVAVQERDLNDDDDFGDAGEVVYYHSNWPIFSIYALTDATENVVERYRYDAYGACTVLDDDWSADTDGLSDVANPYAFTARCVDLETSPTAQPSTTLMQYRYRHYSPALGRFVSRDPQGYSDGLNPYQFVASCPIALVDPLGLVVECPGGKWYFSGRMTQGTLFVASYSSTVGTFECQEVKHVGYWQWVCQEAGYTFTIEQEVYKVPTAEGRIHSVMTSTGLGAQKMFVTGTAGGAETADELGGPGLDYLNLGISVGPLSGSITPDSVGGGLNFSQWGLGGSIDWLGVKYVSIYAQYWRVEEESLNLTERQLLEEFADCCTKTYHPLAKPEWVPNPTPPLP